MGIERWATNSLHEPQIHAAQSGDTSVSDSLEVYDASNGRYVLGVHETCYGAEGVQVVAAGVVEPGSIDKGDEIPEVVDLDELTIGCALDDE